MELTGYIPEGNQSRMNGFQSTCNKANKNNFTNTHTHTHTHTHTMLDCVDVITWKALKSSYPMVTSTAFYLQKTSRYLKQHRLTYGQKGRDQWLQ